MSVTITAAYQGNKRVELTHQPSGAKIITDAPKDNQGEGRSFSPTDLVAAALSSCMMTVLAIAAERDGIDVSGMNVTIEKHMAADPRRVAKLPLTLTLPDRIPENDRARLEEVARNCPVCHSIHDNIERELQIVYASL